MQIVEYKISHIRDRGNPKKFIKQSIKVQVFIISMDIELYFG